jgi:hypothetical protein
MSGSMRRVMFAVIALLAAAFAARGAETGSLRLIEPAAQALRGGSAATLAWSATALPEHTEEWEAFLSIDGGRYYAFRITPHLDIARRRVTWTVPNVDAADARIMIRTGDEREETALELPGSFSIVRDAHAAVPILPAVTTGHGEPAREGDPDVIGWAEGDRTGTRVTERYAAPARHGMTQVVTSTPSESASLLPPEGQGIPMPLAAITGILTAGRRAPAPPLLDRPPADLLLVCSRRNV